MSDQPTNRISRDEAKKLAVSFFYWWHNQPGTNTEQGFDDWWAQHGAEYAAQPPAQAGAEVWHPMETAPKDGTEVILRNVSWNRALAHYMPGGHCIEDHPPIDEGWYFWNGRIHEVFTSPVQWRSVVQHAQPEPCPHTESKQSVFQIEHTRVLAGMSISARAAKQHGGTEQCQHNRKHSQRMTDNGQTPEWTCIDCGKFLGRSGDTEQQRRDATPIKTEPSLACMCLGGFNELCPVHSSPYRARAAIEAEGRGNAGA